MALVTICKADEKRPDTDRKKEVWIMEKVMRTTEDLKNRQLMEKEEQILARMRNYKDFDDSLIDLTKRPKRSKKGDEIVDMRYSEIEKIFTNPDTPAPDIDSEKMEAIESEAKEKAAEETKRMKKAYLDKEYKEAAARARDHRKRMIEMLEARGIGIDESVEL